MVRTRRAAAAVPGTICSLVGGVPIGPPGRPHGITITRLGPGSITMAVVSDAQKKARSAMDSPLAYR